MILDQLSQWQQYTTLGSRFAQAFRHLETLKLDAPLGRFELAGNDLFVLVQTYATKPVAQCRFEAHRQYADIQFILAGQECILWTPLAALTTVTKPYNAEKDIAFFANPVASTPLHLGPGQFAVFWPTDGHAPMGESNGPSDVLKAVAKVRVA